jgi:exocyst complex component 4
VHELITSEIKARAAAMEASRPRVDQVAKLLRSSSIGMYLAPKQRNGINGSSPVAEWGLPVGKAQTDAHELLESVLDLVSQVLGKISCHSNADNNSSLYDCMYYNRRSSRGF